MSHSRDWKEVVLDLRKSAGELRETHPDAALMRCRKATEAILLSIYEEIYGELPSKYFPYETMMAKLYHHNVIPEMIRLAFNTAQQWGNFGSHYQHESSPTSANVDFALGPLDNLVQWRFGSDNLEVIDEDVDDEISLDEMDTISVPVSSTKPSRGVDWIKDARHGRGYRCMECGFRADKWGPFGRHKKQTGHGSVECTICNQYIVSISQLSRHEKQTGHIAEYIGDPPGRKRSIKDLREYLIGLVSNAYELEKRKGEEWVNLARIGSRVKLIEPGFRIQQWGTKKWTELIEVGLDDIFEIRKLKIRHSGKPLAKPTTFEIKPIHLPTN